jgi:N-formylglutamate amidohydrolase
MFPRVLMVVVLPLATFSSSMVLAAMPLSADLVLVQRGTLPIILTAPHGGLAPIPGIKPRNLEDKTDRVRYNAGVDFGTDILAQVMAREIRALTGQDVYLVIAQFHRKFIDANRAPAIAYDSPASEPYYRTYHDTIRRFVDEIRAAHRNGLLVDVHGQHKLPDHLVRGTINGRAVSHLIGRAGTEAVVGPRGLWGQLEANGFSVFPGNDVPPTGTSEDAGFNGGFTVAQYGSHRPGGIDAVQFEFGVKYRRKGEIEEWAKRAARSIVSFGAAYLM